jgi:hypothetical protein
MIDPRCERFLAYFDRAVLSPYRIAPDRFELYEDDMGGYVKVRSAYYDGLEKESRWYQIRFGFRMLVDGNKCVAGFVPDLAELPNSEKLKWHSHELQQPTFADPDGAFERWTARYLGGSWGVEDGPKPRIERQLNLINALTRQTLNVSLWSFSTNPLLTYPAAENTDAYNRAHGELYRILVDAMSAECLAKLAAKRSVTLPDPRKRMENLKQILPESLVEATWKPLKACYDERNKRHENPGAAPTPFSAFDTFHHDLEAIHSGLVALRGWLEQLLGVNAEACLRRLEAMEGLFPKFLGPPRPEFKLGELRKAEGKTIQSVEFGEVEDYPGARNSEGMVFHYTDGSSMAIRIGSNAENVVSAHEGLKPQEFHKDLMVFWAPAIQGQTVSA